MQKAGLGEPVFDKLYADLARALMSIGAVKAVKIRVMGRHDPTIPPRIVPVAEAMVALVLADHLLRQKAGGFRF